MKVDISMAAEKDEFSVSNWWAKSPAFVVESLRRQLEVASAIWPDLKNFKIERRRSRKSELNRSVSENGIGQVVLSKSMPKETM